MKRATVYIVVLTMIAALLSGCGENSGNKNGTQATKPPQATVSPSTAPTILPETMMPDEEDGIVRDDDGIITDEDSGNSDEDSSILTGENTMDPERNGTETAEPGREGKSARS